MRAGLPKKEPEILARWADIDLYESCAKRSRAAKIRAARRPALRQRQHPHRPCAEQDPQGSRHALAADARQGFELCAGLGLPRPADRMEDRGGDIAPRASNKRLTVPRRSSSAASAAPLPSIGSTCSARSSSGSASIGDWAHPYATMSFPAEAQIAREIMKFAANGLLYRGSKPVMWSVVEKTALAEAEVEYEDHTSDTVWVAFPVSDRVRRTRSYVGERRSADMLRRELRGAAPHRRHLDDDALDHARQPRDRLFVQDRLRLYRVTAAPDGNWAKVGATLRSRRQAC